MASKRRERIKNLYNTIMAIDFIKLAEEDEDIEGLEEALMGGEVLETPKKTEEPMGMEALMGKPEVFKQKKPSLEPEEFVPPEELARQLGVEEEIEKKEPILPHRSKHEQVGLFEELMSTKLTPGAFKAKECPVCGAFNFPIWKKECARCKGEYRQMLQDVDFKGYSPRKAVAIAARKSKGSKGKRYLGEEALQEIWDKEGHITLPDETIDIQKELVDRRGLAGVPNRLRLRAILENNLNVVRVPSTVYDEKTNKTYKVTEPYFDPEGNPIPIKFKERDYFTLFEIAKKLQLAPSAILKQISDHNAAEGKDPTIDPDAVKPSAYIDELNQAFSWKAIRPIFAERTKEIWKMNVQNFISRLSKRWGYLLPKIDELKLTLNVRKHEKARLLEDMKGHPQRKLMARLMALRADEQERKVKITKIQEKIEKAKEMGEAPPKGLDKSIEKLKEKEKEALPERKKLERKVGIDLTNFVGSMRNITKNHNRVVKSIKRMGESLVRLKSQLIDYLKSFGGLSDKEVDSFISAVNTINGKASESEEAKAIKTIEELMALVTERVPDTLQKIGGSSTGKAKGEAEGAEDLDLLVKELSKEDKTASVKVYDLHRLLRLAGPEDDPNQLGFFTQFEEAGRKREIMEKLREEPSEEDLKRKKIKIKNIIKRTRVTRDEAEDRLHAQNHPLADEEGLNPKQLEERERLLKQIMSQPPTEEEAAARVEEAEAKPFQVSRPTIAPKEKEVGLSERECPRCGEQGFLEGSDKCQKCTFTSPQNMKQVVLETVIFPFLRDKEGNKIPKLDERGNIKINEKGQIDYKKRIEKRHTLVQIQLDEANRPVWAMARKVTELTRDVGAKTKLERERYFGSTTTQKPRIRDPKPVTYNPDRDYTVVYESVKDETGESVKRPTGEKIHKQKCRGCPEPGKKVKPQNFGEFPPIETAIKFLKGEELPRNTRAWKYEDVFSPSEPETTPKPSGPTILPTGSSRFEQIVRLSLLD